MEFQVGARVRYDDAGGEVLERIPSGRVVSDDYSVLWDNGTVSTVWGTDLSNG
jgi:hypothetical protein